MADLPGAEQPTGPADDLVGRPPGGLVHHRDTGRVVGNHSGARVGVVGLVVLLGPPDGSGSPAYSAPMACSATFASPSLAAASSSSSCRAVSGTTSGMNTSVGVNFRPSCLPTWDRIIPVAECSAAAVLACSSGVPNAV